MIYHEFLIELERHVCPKCGVLGSMQLMMHTYVVTCQACKATHLDPFAVGPFDSKEIVSDILDGAVVATYFVDKLEVDEQEPNQAWLDFIKFERSSRRE
jgi:hypothetical protein